MAQAPDPHARHATTPHGHEGPATGQAHAHGVSLNRLAFTATLHCLSGCAVGEVLGMVIGTALGWTTLPTIVLAVGLAFVFGYAFTMAPLAMVAALRETSVLFAMLIAFFLLGERVAPRRWAAAALILAGIVLMRV